MSEDGLVGEPVGSVVDAIVARDGERDPETVREALDPVTEDGVVTEAAIESAVSDTSKVVATAETRAELADIAYDDAVEAAEPVADLDTVAARLDEYEARLDEVTSRADGLTADLARPVERLNDPDAVYELAVELREVASAAQGVIRTADDLSFDLEEFESWVENSDRRHDEFAEDIDLVGESVDELRAGVEALPEESDDPAVGWADATMRVALLDLLVADLRAELDDLREMADRDGVSTPDLGDRIEDLDARTNALADDLDDLARPAWHDRFDADIAALDRDLDDLVPPVDWGAVQETLAARRAAAFD